jgi:hypothetical protein
VRRTQYEGEKLDSAALLVKPVDPMVLMKLLEGLYDAANK